MAFLFTFVGKSLSAKKNESQQFYKNFPGWLILIWVDQCINWTFSIFRNEIRRKMIIESTWQHGNSARATAENLEPLEEELKTVMAKELENCGPHQAKMKEEMGEVGEWKFWLSLPPRIGTNYPRENGIYYLQDVFFRGGARRDVFIQIENP